MLKLFLILLTSLTFAQSPFWKMELKENETAPSTPRNIAAVGDANKITLTWTDPSQSDFDSVRVYAGTTANPTTWVASVAKGVQSYVDTNYSYNTIRHYRLKALTTSGDTSNYTSSVNDTVMIWLGSELVTNGDFSSGTGWSVVGQYSVSGGVGSLVCDGTYSLLYQAINWNSGYTYRLTYTGVVNSGTAELYKINDSGGNKIENVTAGNRSLNVVVSGAGNQNLIFKRFTATNITVDNLSIKRILNP